jgi:hypothetical protein
MQESDGQTSCQACAFLDNNECGVKIRTMVEQPVMSTPARRGVQWVRYYVNRGREAAQ